MRACANAYCATVDAPLCKIPVADVDLSNSDHHWLQLWRTFNAEVSRREHGVSTGRLATALLSLVREPTVAKRLRTFRALTIQPDSNGWVVTADFLPNAVSIPNQNRPADFQPIARACKDAGVSAVYVDGDFELDEPSKIHLIVGLQASVRFVEFNPKVSR